MPHSQPIPDSTIGLLLLIGFVFFGWALLNLIGNVERNVKRRMLQNFVYRLYQYQRWVTAVVRGLDEGVNAYYKVKDTVAISPSKRHHNKRHQKSARCRYPCPNDHRDG